MSKFIQLTRVYDELTEEAHERLDAANERAHRMVEKLDNSIEKNKDPDGLTVEDYDRMGIPIPEDLLSEKQNKILYEETVDLTEEDYIEVKTKILCNVDDVKYFAEAEKGSIVFYDKEVIVLVEESIEEINKKLV